LRGEEWRAALFVVASAAVVYLATERFRRARVAVET
jgi:hypothetical protein